jgi:hypothetical protein
MTETKTFLLSFGMKTQLDVSCNNIPLISVSGGLKCCLLYNCIKCLGFWFSNSVAPAYMMESTDNFVINF